MRQPFKRTSRIPRGRLALLAAATAAVTGLFGTTQHAEAQTWVNPNNGSWSVGGNWVGGTPPASAVTTQLTFNASGAETYTAFNDIANPFSLNAINFNNTGSGVINLTGNPLSFGGTNAAIGVAGSGAQTVANAIQIVSGADQTPLSLAGNGAGALSLTGAFSSSPASTATAGGYLRQDNPSGTASVSGGGTLYALQASAGNLNVNGGTWTLSSTERGNDPVGAINDGGLWSISVGKVAGQTGRMNITNATINAASGFWGELDGAVGIGTIGAGANVDFNAVNTGNSGRFGINFGAGTLAIVNGGKVTGRLAEIGRQVNANANLLIDGAGSQMNLTLQYLSDRNAGTSRTTISNGGVLNMFPATGSVNAFFVNGPGAIGSLSLLSGGRINQNGQVVLSGGTSSLATGVIDGAGTRWDVTGNVFIAPAVSAVGIFNITNGGLLQQQGQQTIATAENSIATVTISGGGKWDNKGNSFIAIASNSTGDPLPCFATINVTGAGSAYNTGSFLPSGTTTFQGGQSVIGSNGDATLNISAGGSSLAQTTFLGGNGHGSILLSGSGSHYDNGGQMLINGSTINDPNAASALKVSSGARFNNTGGNFFTSTNPFNSTIIDVNGGTVANAQGLITGGGGGGDGGVTTITLSNGGQILTDSANFSQNTNGVTFITGTGTNSLISSEGGVGTGGWLVAPSQGARVSMNLSSGAGAAFGSGAIAFVSGGFVTGTGDPAPGGTADFLVQSGAILRGGQLQTSQGPGGVATFNFLSGGAGTMSGVTFTSIEETGSTTMNMTGAGSGFATSGLIASGGAVNGTGDPLNGGTTDITVSGGGAFTTTGFGATLGNSPNGRTTMNLSGAGSSFSALSGAGTAQLVVADLGLATMNVNSGATSTVQGNVFVAASPGSNGVVSVSGGTFNVSGQTQIGGAGGSLGGQASMSVTNGGAINANDLATVYTGATLTVGAGTTPARFVGSGDVAVDGTVNYNSGTLNVAGTLSVGGNVLLSSRGTSNKKVLDVGMATLTSSGVVDLNDNDMIVRSNQKTYLTQQIRNARNGGLWNAAGVTSTAAKNNPQHNTTLGVLSGAEYSGANGGTTTFNGRTISPTDTLVKYTYYGDTDFNGKVNFDDYVRTDNGFNNHLTGWLNGDFDGNGAVNFDDYVLIDLAFNTQTGTLGRVVDGLRAGPGEGRQIFSAMGDDLAGLSDPVLALAGPSDPVRAQLAMSMVQQHAAEFGDGYVNSLLTRAVPEPTSALSLLAAGALGGALRRRTRRN